MKAIDRLSDSHVLALGRFISGCARVAASTHWRTRFNECARRNHFLPYVTLQEQEHLRAMLQRHDRVIVCGLSTADVMKAANQVATEWGESPVTVELPRAQSAATSG
jgi:hypothetical protein